MGSKVKHWKSPHIACLRQIVRAFYAGKFNAYDVKQLTVSCGFSVQYAQEFAGRLVARDWYKKRYGR
jgi:hypothetical protein